MIKTTVLIALGVFVGSVSTLAIVSSHKSKTAPGLFSVGETAGESDCEIAHQISADRLELRGDGDLPHAQYTVDSRSEAAHGEIEDSPNDSLADAGEVTANSVASESVLDSTNLPEVYKTLLESQPVSKRRMTPQENHSFLKQIHGMNLGPTRWSLG